jgi:hypothetical protein
VIGSKPGWRDPPAPRTTQHLCLFILIADVWYRPASLVTPTLTFSVTDLINCPWSAWVTTSSKLCLHPGSQHTNVGNKTCALTFLHLTQLWGSFQSQCPRTVLWFLSLDPTKAKTRSCMIQCNPKYEKRQKTKRKKTEKYFSAAFKKFI